jgi:hypothetical protein
MKFDKMAAKSKMASKAYVFVFLLSKAPFLPDFKILFCIRSVFLVSNFCGRNFFREINMVDSFKMASLFFGKKNTFFSWSCHRILSFQDGVCIFLLHENMFCERSIRYIKLIFGVSRYFFWGLSYTLLVQKS